MNELILQSLNDYIKNPNPQYVVMLKGKWGCGKTHFIKKWLETFQHNDPEDGIITLEPIYISTYGMTSIADMKQALDREINPFFYSSTGKFIKNTAKILGKIAFKTSFDLDGNGKDETSFSASLDSFALFKSDSKDIKGLKLMVFDDIERCQIDMKQLLGYVNGFVEHCECHVIVIGDESHLGVRKEAFEDFKEKTIGREFEIMPDYEGAIDHFLSEPPACDYLRANRDYIIQCFKSSGYNNLRILRQCLYDFKMQLFQVTEVEYDETNIFLRNFLGSFIAVYFEYANKDNKQIIANWADSYQKAHIAEEHDTKEKLRLLQDKYKTVSQGCIYHVLCPDFVTRIVNHTSKGFPLVGFMTVNIENRPKELTPWEKLFNYYDLDNSEFEDAYRLSMEAAIAGGRINNYQLGVTISYLSQFHVTGIHYFTQANISLIKRQLRILIEGVTTLQDLYQLRVSFIQGSNYVSYERFDYDPCADIREFFLSEVHKKSLMLPDDMQQALRSLSDDNVSSLIAIDKMPYPDRSSSYGMRSIFASEDACQIFNAIKGMSNRGRNEFSSFLSIHYSFSCIYTSEFDRFAKDLPVLTQLKTLVDAEIANFTSIDKHVFRNLSATLERAIKRASGADQV